MIGKREREPLAVPVARYPASVYVISAIAAFAIHLIIATRLYSLHAFAQYDVLFNADPNEGLVNLGQGWGKSEFKHLTLTYLFSPFIRMAAWALGSLSISSLPAEQLRERVVLGFIAALSAVRAVALLEVCRFIGLGLPAAALLTTLAFGAFANLMFGAVPESFVLSGTVIVLGYYLALKPIRATPPADHGGRIVGDPVADRDVPIVRTTGDTVAWAGLFVVGVGVTVTNVVPISLLYLARRLRTGASTVSRELVRAAALGAAAIAFNILLAGAAHRLQANRVVELGYSPTSDQYVHPPSVSVALDVLRGFGNGFVPDTPRTSALAIRPGKAGWYTTMLTFEPPEPGLGHWLGCIAAWALLVLGVVGHCTHRRENALVLASATIIGANLLLHLGFGDEYVLYSYHWYYSVLFLIAGSLLLLQTRGRRWEWLAGCVVVLAITTAGVTRMVSVVRVLASTVHDAPIEVPAERGSPSSPRPRLADHEHSELAIIP